MPPRFDSFWGNVYQVARHAFRTRRYGLAVNAAAARVMDPARWRSETRAQLNDLSDVMLAVLDADRARPGRVDWRAVFCAQLLVKVFQLRFAPADYRRFGREKLKTDGQRVYIEAMEREAFGESP